MSDPFRRVRVTARQRVMVVSAKGGVGKSTMTVNLAAALAARGASVGIFDADVHGPNIPALLGVRQRRDLNMDMNPMAMLPIEARPDALDMRPIQPFERYGIRVMSLALLVGDQQTINPDPKVVGQLVYLLLNRVDWGNVDVLLLDMPPGTGEPLRTLIDEGVVDGALLVATRERLTHLDNGRLVTLLKRKQIPLLGIVENMTHMICPKCGEWIEMYPAPAAEQHVYDGADVLAAVPFHHHLIRQNWGNAPLPLSDPDSPAAVPVLALADAILARLAALPQDGANRSPETEDCEDCP